MKTMKIYEYKAIKLKRKPRFRMIRTGLAIAMALGVGLYLGSATPWSQAETIANDTAIIHVVDTDETLWEIAGPVADKTGQDHIPDSGQQRPGTKPDIKARPAPGHPLLKMAAA